MPLVTTSSVVRTIESLFDGSSVAALSDRQLLERFVARRDAIGEAAFAAIVTRHGPMVLAICRQVLGDRHEADDSFQAVFLVLARRARSIRDPDICSPTGFTGSRCAPHAKRGPSATVDVETRRPP
jgi:Sigma-70 region 2